MNSISNHLSPYTPTPLTWRDAFATRIVQHATAAPAMAQVIDIMTATPANFFGYRVPLRVYVPKNSVPSATNRANVILFFHGGGVAGSVLLYEALCKAFASKTGWVVIAPAYRIAPENRYPSDIDDAHTVLQGLAQTLESINIEICHLTVAGDGTGGAIAATLVQDWLAGRVTCDVAIDRQILLDAVLDYTLSQLSTPQTLNHQNLNDFAWLLEADSFRQNYDWYFSKHEYRELASPYWTDLTRLVHYSDQPLPRCLTITTKQSPLHKENLTYHRLMEQAGFACELIDFANVPHGFWHFATLYPEASQQLCEVIGRFCQD